MILKEACSWLVLHVQVFLGFFMLDDYTPRYTKYVVGYIVFVFLSVRLFIHVCISPYKCYHLTSVFGDFFFFF